MAAKAKGKKGESKAAQVADDSTERLYRAYRRFINEAGESFPAKLEEKFAEIRDEKNPGILSELIIWEPVGSGVVRAISQALRETSYDKLRQIRLWKAASEDEGVRSVCQYLRQAFGVRILEFMDCDVTPLGCEFISTLLGPEVRHPLSVLKLDHNRLGNAGAIALSEGLRLNMSLSELSLTYCDIEEEGARGLFEIVIHCNSGLKILNVQGNYLRNGGVMMLLHGLRVNNSVEELNLTDNQFGEDPEVLQKFADCFHENQTLATIDCRYNGIYDAGAQFLKAALSETNEEGVKKNGTLSKFDLPDNVSPDLREEIEKMLGGRAKKGKKGGGKKGKKKKKK